MPCHTIKTAPEWPKEHDKLKASIRPPNYSYPSLIRAATGGTGTSLIQGGSTLQPIGLQESATSALVPDTTGEPPEVLSPCLNWSEPNLIHVGPSMDWTCSSASHVFLIGLGSGEFRGRFDALCSLSCSSGHF